MGLERDLEKIQGVSSVRVVGDDVPTEIHVVASLGRAPKQVVRDVQSLAAARFGISIDHRIVSVVQLEDRDIEARESVPATTGGRRPVLDRVVLATKADGGWVKVALRWPDGEVTEGAGTSGATRESRARGAVAALAQALEPALRRRDATLDVDVVVLHRLGAEDSVLVRAAWREATSAGELVGSAVIHDDAATAAVRALLQAVNRKLEVP